MLSCVIIDDERHCIDALFAMIKIKFADQLLVKGTAHEAEKAEEVIRTGTPDIVFLDVEMPGATGLQILSRFPERTFEVIFTTAYDRYALEALKTEAIDYLLKPISIHELATAIEKARKHIELKKASQALQTAGANKIILPTGKGSMVIELKDIVRFESCNNYCTVFFTKAPKLVIARTLKVFEDQLQSRKNFFRIHQSHLINLDHLQSYRNGDPSYAILSDGTKVEISRRRKMDFLKAIHPAG